MKYRLVSLIACSTILFGCGTANKLVGIWEAEINQMGQKMVINQVINGDGSFQQTVSSPSSDSNMGNMTIVTKGTWKMDEDTKAIITPKEIEVKGGPTAAKSFISKMFETQKNKPSESTLKWNGTDEVTISSAQGPSITFKRKKGS